MRKFRPIPILEGDELIAFWAKVEILTAKVPAPTDLTERFDVPGAEQCWLHSGYERGEYPTIKLCGKIYIYHRAVWVQYNREQPPLGYVIDHICMRSHCLNPKHHRPLTLGANLAMPLKICTGSELLSRIVNKFYALSDVRETLGPERRLAAAYKAIKTKGPEGVSAAVRKANETRGPEGRSAAVRKGKETMGPERLSEAGRKRAANMGPERMSKAARKGKKNMGPVRRSAAAKKRAANMGPVRIAVVAAETQLTIYVKACLIATRDGLEQPHVPPCLRATEAQLRAHYARDCRPYPGDPVPDGIAYLIGEQTINDFAPDERAMEVWMIPGGKPWEIGRAA